MEDLGLLVRTEDVECEDAVIVEKAEAGYGGQTVLCGLSMRVRIGSIHNNITITIIISITITGEERLHLRSAWAQRVWQDNSPLLHPGQEGAAGKCCSAAGKLKEGTLGRGDLCV